ncbi:hypothetical protein [Roseomonas fluvialis]|uniref:DUF2244 domain-containing protein n=1 Tax=Roseomonas fluvialis TaxID=1750527 RepID=A0ABM7Y7I1_9PROT|nr:hypothetical protein [Roseomonas fluvialis]BDG73983.1 hypothetical protein Rmf_39120 [Roseomonas fluvialis]
MAAPDAVTRARGSLQRQEPEGAPGDTLMSDGQRRVVFAMLAAGLAWLLVGLLVPPYGAAFWVWFTLAPPVLGAIAALFGGRRGIDAWLLGGGRAKPDVAAVAPAALPAAARDALRLAVVPALLNELARASVRMPASEKAAAGLVIEAATRAWNAAPDDAARLPLARALPGLVAGLLAGGAEAIRAADAFAAGGGLAR